MLSVEKCPICGGEIVTKEVDKLLRGGNHTAILKVSAEVCLSCGERLYPVEQLGSLPKLDRNYSGKKLKNFKRWDNLFALGKMLSVIANEVKQSQGLGIASIYLQ